MAGIYIGFKGSDSQAVFMDRLAKKDEITVSALVRVACEKIYGMPHDDSRLRQTRRGKE